MPSFILVARRAVLQSAIAAAALIVASPAIAQTTPPEASSHLVVGDVAAAKLHVYALPEMQLLTTIDDVALGAHAGVVTLTDGRVLIPDDRNKQLLVLKIGAGAPAIERRVPMPIPLPTRYAWAAVDPAQTVYVVTGLDSDESVKMMTIVDLKSYAARQFRVDTGSADAELNLAVGGDSETMIYVHLAERVDAYKLADLMGADAKINSLLEGKIKPAATLAVGKGGHSNSYSAPLKRFAASTSRGFETTGAMLDGVKVVPWEANDRSGGRNARQRSTTDGMHVFGPLNATVAPPRWADAEVDLHWVDLKTLTAQRVPLAKGAVGRGGVSSRFAVYASIHPDGDHANLVDADPASATFRQVTARVPLPKLANGPVAGSPTAGREGRHSAITPDGRFAFVTQGGEGKVHVIDPARKEIVRTIETPTPLRGGGFIVGVQAGAATADLSAR
jgi:DNA-binding beta-propeller fold protein YncE